MRIIHTEWSDGLGGQEKRVLAEVSGLIARGHYVAIACRSGARIRTEAEKHGIEVFTLPMRGPYDAVSITRLSVLLKNKHFEVMNTHSGIDSWIGGIASKIARVPLLARTRHLDIPLKRNPLNFVHYLPDIYITCGKKMRERLVTQCGFPSARVISIPTGVDPDLFALERNAGLRQKYGLREDAVVITNIGILRSVKGHETTLNAAKEVLAALPNTTFLLVGDGPRKHILEAMAHRLGISQQVKFTGYMENIPEVLSITDVSVLSSWSEGLPQGILQSMASGVPVVATNVGGVPEVVRHETTGILVEPGDHHALAQGIMKIVRNPSLGHALAKNARELVLKEHSSVVMLDALEGLYKELLHKKTSR